jgi:hypothetical protein
MTTTPDMDHAIATDDHPTQMDRTDESPQDIANPQSAKAA